MTKGTLRFLPPEGAEILHIARTDGHSVVVHAIDPTDGQPGTEVPVRFRKDVIAEGCEVVGIATGDSTKPAAADKDALILKAIAAVMERQAADELEGDGRPKVAALKKEAGFGVTKAQFEAVWPQYVDSLGEDEGEDEIDSGKAE